MPVQAVMKILFLALKLEIYMKKQTRLTINRKLNNRADGEINNGYN
jgi:hypothetical protein